MRLFILVSVFLAGVLSIRDPSVVPAPSQVVGNLDGHDEISGDEEFKLHLLADPVGATVDIVAVHGLDGHWRGSWTAQNGVFWLKDLLPHEIPVARIFSFGHDSRTRGGRKPLTLDISDHGKDLVTSLINERRLTKTDTRPLILIGHSMGGLVIKSALLHSDMARVGHLERQKSIKLSTYAVLFLGTPHQGGEGVPLAQIMTSVFSAVSYTNPKLLDQISRHSDWLQDLQARYNSVSRDFETIFFYETHKMTVAKVGQILVVPKFSAIIQGAVNAEDVSMSADHSTMAKYSGPADANFQKLVKRLRVLVGDAAPRVRQNWVRWHAIKAMEAPAQPTESEADQVLSSNNRREFHLGLAIDRIRNYQFVGRETTLLHLAQLLQGKPGRDQFNLVVLYGIGGIGKTEIALEYAYMSKSQYSSIFWIDGSSNEAARHSIRRYLEKMKSHYDDMRNAEDNPRYRRIKEALDQTKPPLPPNSKKSEELHYTDPEVHQLLTDAFIHWLSCDDNSHWLIILDNVDDLESFDFRELLPTTQWGAVVVTSRRSDLAVKWDAIEVTDMDEDEAINLLMESAKQSPRRNTCEWKNAKRLVEVLGYFPLAIIQAGSFVAINRKNNPISSYLELFQGHPRRMLDHKPPDAVWDYRKDTVLTTWEISYNAVYEQMPGASKILLLCGFLARDEIYEELFIYMLPSSGQSEGIQVQQAFNLLMSYSFVQRNSDGSAFFLHPLVHLWARLRLDPRDQEAVALEALQMLYRYKKSPGYLQYSSLSRHIMELFSFYDTQFPCKALDAINIGANEVEFVAVLQGAFYWIKGKFDEAISFVHRTYITDGVSPLRHWELFDQMRGDAPMMHSARISPWTACQAVSSFGSKHPRALYVLGNYAFDLFYMDELEESLAWYRWLLSTRMRVLGDSDPATAGAMLGIARTTQDCNEAVHYALGGYQRRFDVLGFDDYLTRNAIAVLDETEENCEHHLEVAAELSRQKMTIFQSLGGLSIINVWPEGVDFILNLRLARAFLAAGSTIDGASIIVAILERYAGSWTKEAVYGRQAAIDAVMEFAHDISWSGYVEHLNNALQRSWDDSNPYDLLTMSQHQIDRRCCVQIFIPIVMSMIHAGNGNIHMAEHWLARLQDFPTQWFASGSCDYYGPGPGNARLPHVYLEDIIHHSLCSLHAVSCPTAIAHAVASLAMNQMIFSNNALGLRLLLSGWHSTLCPAAPLGLSDALRRLYRRLYCDRTESVSCLEHAFGKLAAKATEFAEKDESESCFRDVRRAFMCRANRVSWVAGRGS